MKPLQLRVLAGALLALLTTLTTLTHLPAATATAATADGCPGVNGDYAGPGPFGVTTEAGDSAHTVYRPTNLGRQGCTSHPVIIWGNGTYATPSVYAGLLKHLASEGFIVVAANTTQSGSGQEMLAGIDWITEKNSDPSSIYYQKVDLAHIGASGHSQGGGGAVNAGADPRVDAVVPIEPGPQGSNAALHGPTLWLAGQNDNIVNANLLVKPRYEATDQVVSEYGLLAGATHFTAIGDAGGFRGPVTAWFRYWLMGDQEAGSEFFGPSCGECTSSAWADFERNARALAVAG
ncbi:poly(ethylene terephthalate) hydrolase family protein [Nocardioides ultimimeridianus]